MIARSSEYWISVFETQKTKASLQQLQSVSLPFCDSERMLLSLTHAHIRPPSTPSFPHTSPRATWDRSAVMQSWGLHSQRRSCWWRSDLLGAAACVRALPHQLWPTQMFCSQSDNKTIFSWGCPHMGEFTAGELSVCECNMGECEWGADKHPAASRWWDWEHGKQREEDRYGKSNWTLNTRSDRSHLHRTSHTQTQLDSSAGTLHIQRKDSYVIVSEIFQ